MGKMVRSAVSTFAFIASIAPVMAQSADEPTRDLLASQIRDQGFACSKPKSAEHDVKATKPNETVWILNCENDTFRMTVIPDMAAKVEKLNK